MSSNVFQKMLISSNLFCDGSLQNSRQQNVSHTTFLAQIQPADFSLKLKLQN